MNSNDLNTNWILNRTVQNLLFTSLLLIQNLITDEPDKNILYPRWNTLIVLKRTLFCGLMRLSSKTYKTIPVKVISQQINAQFQQWSVCIAIRSVESHAKQGRTLDYNQSIFQNTGIIKVFILK